MREPRSGRAGRATAQGWGLPLAGALLAVLGCVDGCGSTRAAVFPPDADSPVAVSPDGRTSLRVRASWEEPDSPVDRSLLLLDADLEPEGPGVLVAPGNPLHGAVAADGTACASLEDRASTDFRAPPGVPGWTFRSALRIGRGTDRLTAVEYAVPVLRVGTWKAFETVSPRAEGATTLDAPPFRVAIETGPEICQVVVTGGSPPLPGPDWAARALEVRDARGGRMEALSPILDGTRGTTIAFAPPPGAGAIAYPVTVRLRVPDTFEEERIPLVLHDLALPPRPGRIVDPHDSGPVPPDLGAAAWPAWPEPESGLRLRALLPAVARRGDELPVECVLGFDPATLPEGTGFLDARDLPGSLALLFRNRDTGREVERAIHEGGKVIEQPVLREKDGTEPLPPAEAAAPDRTGPRWIPVRDGAARRWRFRFPLARCWDALEPGFWEVRVRLDVPGREADLWKGTALSSPLPLRIVEAPPRRVRVRVPTGYRLRPGPVKGTVDIAFGPAETAVVELEARNGMEFALGVGNEGFESMGWGYREPWVDPVAGTVGADDTGPVDRQWTVRILEMPAGREHGVPLPEPGRDGCRVLWKGAFTLQAAAAEVEAARRR